MKNTTTKFLLFSISIAVFFGCANESLNDNPEENVDPEVVSELIADLYSKMYTPGSGGTQSHGDFGHKSYDLLSDLLIGDMAVTSHGSGGWVVPAINNHFGTTDFTHSNNYRVWTQYYGIIEVANIILDLYGGDSVDPQDEENRHFFGQALAMRALAYFYLTQYMSNNYDPAAPILPIYTESNSDYMPKSTTAEVFQLIESDLNRAIEMLENYLRPSKLQINKYVAEAILAYTIAAQRDSARFNEVIQLCDEVIASSGATIMDPLEVLGGFNNVETSGWIWGVDLTYDMNIGLLSWWGQVDFFSYSYAAAGDSKAIDENLFNNIPSDDVRKGQFFNGTGYNYLQPIFKFYDEDRQAFGGTNELTDSDYVFMRIAEMYLLKAEILAKLGNDPASRMALSEVLNYRIPDISYLDGLSNQELQDEIYFQTRIEFWGEGKAYLAMKRGERSTGVRGENHYYQDLIGTSYNHYDERLTFEIPQSVIDSNPFINDQN